MTDQLVIIGFLVIIGIFAIRSVVHIVPEWQRLVVLAFGRYQKTAGPGLVLLFPPPVQTQQTVDLREFVVEIPEQT